MYLEVPKSEEKVLSICCVVKEEKKILLIGEKITTFKSCVFEALVVETIEDSNVKGSNAEIFVVVCVGMSIANFLSK